MTALFLYTQNMKRILFLVVCLMSFSAKADMDKLCYVDEKFLSKTRAFITENCERNNILYLQNTGSAVLVRLTSEYCRFDRNVVRDEYKLTCVLYDNKPRAKIEN